MFYLLLSLLSFFVYLLFYLRVADHFDIIDKPNQRSSHTQITARGGGIVFVVACMWAAIWGHLDWALFWGIAHASLIGFVDDIKPLPAWVRLLIHFLSLGIVMWALQMLGLNILWLLAIAILFIGWVNAFNFMDGINGITVFYALSALVGFYFIPILEADRPWMVLMILALFVFGFFNVRKQARAFAGDVGSISMAFALGILMLKLIYISREVYWILFFAVYGIDTVCTIVFRLRKGENIFIAHRSHLYQYLANELRIPHVQVSLLYFAAQLLLNGVVLKCVHGGWMSNSVAVMLLLLYSILYLFIRLWVNKKILGLTYMVGFILCDGFLFRCL